MEETAVIEPVTWLKSKYSAEKTKGRYKGGEHGAPKRKHKKMPSKVKSTAQRVMVINTEGKTTWIWRAI
jgi:hypothetical protein